MPLINESDTYTKLFYVCGVKFSGEEYFHITVTDRIALKQKLWDSWQSQSFPCEYYFKEIHLPYSLKPDYTPF